MHIIYQPEQVASQDRALHYGDGLFETLLIQDGRARAWERHQQRLAEGCQRLRIAVDWEQLTTALHSMIEGCTRGVVKVLVSRGVGQRGYRLPQPAETQVYLWLHPYHAYPEAFYSEGISACVCDSRWGSHAQLAGLKHLNRLENVLARAEWQDEFAEGLMLDQQGAVVSGTMSNVFLWQKSRIVTPELNDCGIRGTMRAEVMQRLQRLGLTVQERPISLAEVYQAEAVFFTNSLIGIWPVARLHAQTYTIPAALADLTQEIRRCLV